MCLCNKPIVESYIYSKILVWAIKVRAVLLYIICTYCVSAPTWHIVHHRPYATTICHPVWEPRDKQRWHNGFILTETHKSALFVHVWKRDINICTILNFIWNSQCDCCLSLFSLSHLSYFWCKLGQMNHSKSLSLQFETDTVFWWHFKVSSQHIFHILTRADLKIWQGAFVALLCCLVSNLNEGELMMERLLDQMSILTDDLWSFVNLEILYILSFIH